MAATTPSDEKISDICNYSIRLDETGVFAESNDSDNHNDPRIQMNYPDCVKQVEMQNGNAVNDILENGSERCDRLFGEMQNVRIKNVKNVIIGHLNVNSVGSKIQEIKELQRVCEIDVLVLSESKLDESFKQELLDIDGYCCVRQDKRSNSGGLLTYISNDIPHSVGSINVCNNEIECMSIELNISDEKVMLLCMYKNPRTDPVTFKTFFEDTFEKISDTYENVIIIGDLNFNMLQDNMLSKIMPSYNLANIINKVTCFKSSDPTLIDVMLVTKRKKFIRSFSVSTGISDFHNLIGGVFRLHKPVPKTKRISVRKLSKIDYEKVRSELSEINLPMCVMSATGVNDAYDIMQRELRNLLDKHAPKKQKIIKKNDFHCMSKELRKAMYQRNRLRNKYFKFRSNDYLTLYKIQRNKVTAIKRQTTSKYFEEKCKEGTKNKDFWKAVKPIFSKSRTKADTIPLRENGEIVTDEQTVCKIFNTFFQSIGSEIGSPENNDGSPQEIIHHYDSHSSVKMITDSIKGDSNRNTFIFRFVSERDVAKTISSLSVKKAAGYDELPAKFIKMLREELIKPLALLINRCILENEFPNQMKKANISPLYKKKDKLNKDNYRSVNLLPVMSKILERILYDQVYEYMAPLFHKHLSGFRRKHSCQDVLIRMTEDWRESLDKGLNVGVVAIDLSKAFDCMPQGLLLAKLSAYGFSASACDMMKSYIMRREQRVKIGETYSEWVQNIKGVPQGSILGPLLFNIFINDFLFDDFESKIHNYADDNTLSCEDCDQVALCDKLTRDCIKAMEWFEVNNMKANASKFQVMILSKNRTQSNAIESIKINETELKTSTSINVLGVEIDRELKFKKHINETCSKMAKQVNAVKRIKNFLDKKAKSIIYNSYMKCNLNYCSVVWMFANKTEIEKLERTNKRALRVVTNKGHLSYEKLCKEEKQLDVLKHCVKSAAILMYKIRNGIAPQYVNEMFTIQESHYEMRDNSKFSLPTFQTVRYGKNSFRYYGAKLWNNIPLEIKKKDSLSTFKSSITQWLLYNDLSML